MICDELGVDVWQTIRLANRHPRVNVLQPGPGVGGHCIAIDPWFIVHSAPAQSKLIHTARNINNHKPNFVLKKIEQAIAKTEKERKDITIATLGLAYKADIDDLRESPALRIAQRIGNMKISKQYLVEPNISQMPNDFDDRITALVKLEVALEYADIVVLLVGHTPFKEMPLEWISNKQVVDTCGIWSTV